MFASPTYYLGYKKPFSISMNISGFYYIDTGFTGKYTTREIHKNYIGTQVVYFP